MGSITNFFQRISNYLSHNIEVKDNGGTIAVHFFEGNCTANHFNIMGIAQLEDPPKRKPDIRIKLEELEGYWKVRLNTLKVHITPLTKFRPERTHVESKDHIQKISGIGLGVSLQSSFFSFEKIQNYDVTSGNHY